MATKAIMVEWGMPLQGRELKALETFASNVAYWTKLQEDSKIERFSTFGDLTGNTSSRAGFVLIEGSDDQINNLMVDETWRTNLVGVMTIGNNIQVNLLETGDMMQTRMERYAKAVKAVG